jgi:hypothetical protein
VVAACRQECRLGAEALLELEAQHVAVEGDRTVEVGDLEVDVADARTVVDHIAHACLS